MHLLSHFREHVERFGNIPMFSTDVSELAHRRQIKMAYTASNKVDATAQILDYHPKRMVMEMRVLNLKDIVFSLPEHYEGLPSHRESLRDLFEIFKNEDQQIGGSERLLDGDAPQKPKMTTPHNSATRLSDIADIIKMNRTTLARAVSEYGQGLQREEGGLLSLLDYPVRYFKCLQVPVSVFQKSDNYEIHNIRFTGEALFRKRAVRNDWAWIKVATTDPWGACQGRLPGHLKAIFRLRNIFTRKTYQLCLVKLLEATDKCLPEGSHGLLKVARRSRQRF
ncbi:hypothetical protein P167DRAFT_549664 [Morchella conica CCBAS932]|uniref:Uncharacterized protein n=1 Tax=Morchella conica CCBAS932 TaxID=1392247 RepID=A0A3N4KAK8_9PEZI|nr:hypothetical protein P167DRAFT_549664 [Morchella conica CCBAS932]